MRKLIVLVMIMTAFAQMSFASELKSFSSCKGDYDVYDQATDDYHYKTLGTVTAEMSGEKIKLTLTDSRKKIHSAIYTVVNVLPESRMMPYVKVSRAILSQVQTGKAEYFSRYLMLEEQTEPYGVFDLSGKILLRDTEWGFLSYLSTGMECVK